MALWRLIYIFLINTLAISTYRDYIINNTWMYNGSWSWGREVTNLIWENSKKTLFHKHLRMAVDKKLRVQAKHLLSISDKYIGENRKRLSYKFKRTKRKYRKFANKNPIVIGKTRHKLKPASFPTLETVDENGEPFPKSKFDYETAEMLDSKAPIWRLPWLQQLWYNDHGRVFKHSPLILPKNKRQFRNTYVFLYKQFRTLAASNLKTQFSSRIKKLSYIINNYIRSHSQIPETFETVKKVDWRILTISN